MAVITQLEEGYVINGDIYVGEHSPSTPMKTVLAHKKGASMRYGTTEASVIDFPGEYEHNGVVVRCWESGEQLHYILRFPDGETVAILMNPKSVEHDTLQSASIYLCSDVDTKERLEQNEFEGDIMLFVDAVA